VWEASRGVLFGGLLLGAVEPARVFFLGIAYREIVGLVLELSKDRWKNQNPAGILRQAMDVSDPRPLISG